MKKRTQTQRKPRSTYWHLYNLQTLNSEKFIKMIDKILGQEFHIRLWVSNAPRNERSDLK